MNIREYKVTFVAGLHGNEQMPIRALKESHTPFILGNPRAQKKNVRFIDHDLNSSFGIQDKSYEAKRAREILKEIDKNDFVIDFHTTMAQTPPFVIVLNKKMIPLAARTGLSKVVFMKYNMKRNRALINHRDGIAIETGNHNSRKSYHLTLQVVKNILANRKYPIKLYEVYDKITKPGRYCNFKKHSDGFIPILTGEESYDFHGLKARRLKKC